MNLSIGLALILLLVFSICLPFCAIVSNVNISKTLKKNPFILIICYDLLSGKTNVNKAFNIKPKLTEQ
jgi:predicted MPP superfamily phosphohydrolase